MFVVFPFYYWVKMANQGLGAYSITFAAVWELSEFSLDIDLPTPVLCRTALDHTRKMIGTSLNILCVHISSFGKSKNSKMFDTIRHHKCGTHISCFLCPKSVGSKTVGFSERFQSISEGGILKKMETWKS